MQIRLVLTREIVHLASFWKWGFLELGSGLFNSCFTIHLKVPKEAYFLGFLFNFILFLGSVFLFKTIFIH